MRIYKFLWGLLPLLKSIQFQLKIPAEWAPDTLRAPLGTVHSDHKQKEQPQASFGKELPVG